MSKKFLRSRSRTRQCTRLVLAKIAGLPRWVRVGSALTLGFAAIFVINLVYQVSRKPSELLFFVGDSLKKSPTETWRSYGLHFRTYSTRSVSPELLAALAQVESSGDPIGRTYWRWEPSYHPFRIYRPASSAVGLFQTTDPAYAEVTKFCIRDSKVMSERCGSGPYFRTVPSHAVELASIYLDRNVRAVLSRAGNPASTAQQREDLAAIIHLCGGGPATAHARRRFLARGDERCGDHHVATYIAKVNFMKRRFQQLAANSVSH